jgi:photosystem II stability/assembly factor-like uncharacterized protein
MRKYFYLLASFCFLSFSNKPEEKEGTIFLSRDHGESWAPSDSGFPVKGSVNAMILSGKTVVVGTEEHGIYISEDGLKSWIPSNKGLPVNIKINALVAHQNVILAGSYRNGIYVSYNNGLSWESSNRGLGNFTIRCFYSHRSTIFVGTDHGIYSSDDQGKNWKLAILGAQINALTSYHGILFAATSHGALRSEDLGETWSWVYRNGTLANIAVDGENLISMTGDHRILIGADLGRQWLDFNFNFGQYTFRVTPFSTPLLIAPWRNEFESLHSLRCDGLPEKVPFTRILATPYGLLVARSYGFC